MDPQRGAFRIPVWERTVAGEAQFGSANAFQGRRVVQQALHTVRGRNDERYDNRVCVTDQRDLSACSVFSASSFIPLCLPV